MREVQRSGSKLRLESQIERLESRRLMHAGDEGGVGLVGQYFDNADFTAPVLTRTDPQLNFYWDAESPAPGTIAPDTFSARWTGQVLAPSTESITFTARTDDGARVWVNNQLIIDHPAGSGGMTESSGTIDLIAGTKYDIRIDYTESTGRAGAKLYWQTPTMPRELVPTAHLFPNQTPVPELLPSAPSNLTATPQTTSSVNLTWNDNADNETGFELLRSAGMSNFITIATVAPGTTQFVDTGLSTTVRYFYRIRAISAVGPSGWSAYANAVTGDAPASPPPNTTPLAVPLRINVGGGAFTDTAGKPWLADTDFSGGTISATALDVSNTTDDALFSSRRFEPFNYALPINDGAYTLNLYFADPVYSTVGSRVFNVSAEGQPVLSNFDIAAEAGGQTALVKSVAVTVTDGTLNLDFSAVTENPILSAIEVLPAPTGPTSAPPAPTGLTAAAQPTGSIRLTWTDVAQSETGFIIERATPGGDFSQLTTVSTNTTAYTDAAVSVGVTYRYRVRAVNEIGLSDPSNISSAGIATQTDGTLHFREVSGVSVGRSEAMGAVVRGKFYLFGGYVNDTFVPTARADMYDPTTDKWKQIADLPTGLTHVGLVSDGTYIYFAGGYPPGTGGHSQTFSTSRAFYYDPATNTYHDLPNLPSPRGGGAVALLGRTLHFVGGSDAARNDSTDHWALDLDNISAGWTTLSPLLIGRNHLGAYAIDGQVFAVGGQRFQDEAAIYTPNVDAWNPATNLWTPVTNLPTPRSHMSNSTFIRAGKLIVMGGLTTREQVIKTVSSYDPILNKWTDLTPLPAARLSGVADLLPDGSILFATGGGGGFNKTTWIGEFT